MQEQNAQGKGRLWAGIGIAALAALLVWVWQARQGPDAAQFFRLAAEARGAGKLTEAVIQYKSGLQRAPDDPVARRALGQTYLALHQPAAALTEFERVRARRDAAAALRIDIAEAQLQLGKVREAQATLDSYRGPRTAAVNALAVKLKIALGDPAAAGKLLAAARAQDPGAASLELATARLALSQHDLAGARTAVEAALKIAPQDVEALILQGRVARLRREPAAAVTAFAAASALEPQNAEALAGLVDAKIVTRDLDGAAAALAAFRKVAAGSLQAELLSGSLAYARGEWAEAVTALAAFVLREPRQPQALLMLAGSYFRLGQLNQAEAVLKTLTPLQAPGQTAGQRLQAVILLKQHRAADAVQVLRPLVAGAGSAPDPGLLALLAQAYAASGNKQEASRLIKQAEAAAPGDAGQIQTQLALAQIQTGEAGQSLTALQALVSSAPDNLAARQALTYGQLAQGEAEAAVESARLLVEMAPKSALSHNLAGLAYARTGAADKAAEAFARAVALDPGFAAAIANQGFLALAGQRTDEAKGRLEAALKVDPGYTPASLALSALAERAGDTARAIALLSEALVQHPDAVAARWQLAANQRRAGQTATALATAAAAYQQEPETSESRLRLGEFQLRAGAADAPFETLSQLPTAVRSRLPAGLLFADAARLSRRDEVARQQYQTLLQAQPGARPVWWGLFATELASKRYDAAAGLIGALRKRPGTALDADRAAGELASARGDWAAARSAFDKLFAAEASGQNLLRLVQAARAAGDLVAAEQSLAQWVEKHPEDLPVRLMQGSLALDARRWDAAQAAFEAVLATRAEHPVALNNLAWLYDRRDDPFNPTDGGLGSLVVTIADRVLSDTSFVKAGPGRRGGCFPRPSRDGPWAGTSRWLSTRNTRKACKNFC